MHANPAVRQQGNGGQSSAWLSGRDSSSLNSYLASHSPAMIGYIAVVGKRVDKPMHKMDDMVQDDMVQVFNH